MSFLLASVYRINGLVKSRCLRMNASVNLFFNSFYVSFMSDIQQFSNLIKVISFNGLTICSNSWIKKLITSKNFLSFEIMVGLSNILMATILLESEIISSTEIQWPNNFILDLANLHFFTLIFNFTYLVNQRPNLNI